MSDWDEVLSDSPIDAYCSRELHNEALAKWMSCWETMARGLRESGSPLQVSDLIRVLETVRNRLRDSPLPEGHEVLIDDVEVNPDYVAPQLEADRRKAVKDGLASLAYVRDRHPTVVGMVTDARNWAATPTSIEVQGRILIEGYPDGFDLEPGDDRAAIRELLRVWTTPDSILRELMQAPCALMSHIRLGVRAAWSNLAQDGDATELRFRVGSRLMQSINDMNYANEPRRATACLRVMALIAGGLAASVEGHRERQGPSGNDPVITDDRGRHLHRAYLARHSPNAHRLFWWDGGEPEFVSVGGHEDGPRI